MAILETTPHIRQSTVSQRTNLVSLMYHDVVAGEDHRETGFDIDGAELYKLTVADFERHLRALSSSSDHAPSEVRGHLAASDQRADQNAHRSKPFTLTFDDGGKSAHSVIAPLLEGLGWRGHFFVATDMIGQPSFLDEAEVLDLHRRGHVIGSHSASHPERMSSLSPAELFEEWRGSLTRLSAVIGADVRVASVPNGYYSLDVARAASAAGIRALFTSEPTVTAVKVSDCLVLGRFSVVARTAPSAAAALVGHSPIDRLKQSCSWSVRKFAKSVAGEHYLALRSKLLRRGG